ncbi:myrcene synthase [Quercus suber]|uniref:Myrcene synthase n=1 Tax=Quercus suber TaxID=58331 RepID=A0AAW0K7P2_QUESU
MANSKISKSTDIVRRSANYQAPIWDYDYIQSLRSEYVEEVYTGKINKLKGQVRMMLQKVADPLEQLELIDILQKLGLSYHFECEMKRMLEVIYNNDHGDEWKEENLYAIALKFQLLRQHGYRVSEEVFDSFMEEGSFKGYLCDDTKGILSLYEASFLSLEGENILEEAREFTKNHLQEFINQNKDQNLSIIVSHALELPLHWRISRVEARWFIDVYGSREDMNAILLELAKLDFNMVQATHQEDIKQVSRWWRSIGLAEKLSFVRNRIIESFFWTVGISTKVNQLITVIDDIYDVYGTLDELELFTNAVESWNINAMDGLPDYMKLCFLALHNSVNEMAFDTLKEQGFHIIQYFKKAWVDICRAYLLEAKWYYNGYTPSLQEYLENACFSIGAPMMLLNAYFSVTDPITKEALDFLEECPNIVLYSSIIVRLADDLGTSTDELERGDVPKSIHCYMNETGASEEDAREYTRYLISETWKKMNEERDATSPLSETFIEIVFNIGRMAQCMYQYGYGHGAGNHETKDRLSSLFIDMMNY